MHPLCYSSVWQFPLPLKCIFKLWVEVRAFVASPIAFTLTYGKKIHDTSLLKGKSNGLSRSPHRTNGWTDGWVDKCPPWPQRASRWAEALSSTDQLPPLWLRTLRCDSQLSPQRPWTQSFFNYTRAFTKKLTWTAIQWLKHKPYLYFISVFQSFFEFFSLFLFLDAFVFFLDLSLSLPFFVLFE